MYCPTALIAEDEPLLAQALRGALAQLWPELTIVDIVGNGLSAVERALHLKPDILFFDIQMPGLSGLEAAAELADQWSFPNKNFPALVFVTAFDQYALQAFDAQAVDYVLKPVQPQRLQKTIQKLQIQLTKSEDTTNNHLEHTLAQLRHMLTNNSPQPLQNTYLKFIQASVLSAQGNSLRMIPIEDVLYFDAADKYTRVMTVSTQGQQEYLLRTPLKALLPQLDPTQFWQIHRSTVVCCQQIRTILRDDLGKIQLHLKASPDILTVSRLYAHLFKAM